MKEQRAGLEAMLVMKLKKTHQKPTPQIQTSHVSRAAVTGTDRLVCLYSSLQALSSLKASGVCSAIAVWGFMYVAPISVNGS